MKKMNVKKEKAPLSPKMRKRNRRIKKAVKLVAVLGVVIIVGVVVLDKVNSGKPVSGQSTYTIATVGRRDITTVLSSSGSIAPLNTYNITTLVKGEIIAADFEAGDTVNLGDVLYQLTTDDVDNTIATAQKSVDRAQSSYDKSVTNYNKALDSYEEAVQNQQEAQEEYDEKVAKYEEAKQQYDQLYEIASYTGTVSNIYVEEGQSITKKAKIADIYDDSTMVLTVPFHSDDVQSSWVGKKAEVQVTGSFETLTGTVTKVSEINNVLSGNQVVRNVTISINNPGGITSGITATATINGIDCYEEGTFAYGLETTLVSTKAGEVEEIYIEQGSKISKNSKLISITSDSVETSLSSYMNSVDQAENSLNSAVKSVESAQTSISNAEDSMKEASETLEDAKDALQDAKDSLADCAITSPVTGVVVSKNMLVGDNIGTSNFNNTLATIYDVSKVTFQMEIDELDIKSIQVGQKVNVTADALERQKFEGVITNVSLESTSSGGVTQYPVTVQIDKVGDLLVGMNVTGEIVLQGVENVLCVPVDALKRGNTLYVKDDSVTEANGNVPAGFKSVTVETGLSDGDYIEIKSGISEGDEIYITRNASETTGFNLDFFGQGSQSGMSGGMQGGNMPNGGMSGNGQGNRQNGSNSGQKPGRN